MIWPYAFFHILNTYFSGHLQSQHFMKSIKSLFDAYLAIIVVHEIVFASSILSNNYRALCILLHFTYISIKAFTTKIFNEKSFLTTLWLISIHSSRAPIVSHAGRVLAKVAKFGFTLDKHISLKVARAFIWNSYF